VLQTRPELSAPPPPQAGIEEHLDQPVVSMIDDSFPVGEPLSPDVNVNRNHNHRQEPLHNALDETPSSDNPTIPPHYKMAEPNRRYDMWPTEMISGTSEILMPLRGGLLPAGYEVKRPNSQKYEWHCPVRTCTRMFLKRQHFSCHFERAHFGCKLNDNRDGTFSIVGVYKTGVLGKGGQPTSDGPPVVVSRIPFEKLSIMEKQLETSPLPQLENPAPESLPVNDTNA